jgi:hypothetical protein
VFDALHERPTTSPAATSGRRPRRGKWLLAEGDPYNEHCVEREAFRRKEAVRAASFA